MGLCWLVSCSIVSKPPVRLFSTPLQFNDAVKASMMTVSPGGPQVVATPGETAAGAGAGTGAPAGTDTGDVDRVVGASPDSLEAASAAPAAPVYSTAT